MDDADQALDEYIELFGEEPPLAFGLSDDYFAAVLRDHIDKGERIPPDFDWFSWVPEDADA